LVAVREGAALTSIVLTAEVNVQPLASVTLTSMSVVPAVVPAVTTPASVTDAIDGAVDFQVIVLPVELPPPIVDVNVPEVPIHKALNPVGVLAVNAGYIVNTNGVAAIATQLLLSIAEKLMVAVGDGDVGTTGVVKAVMLVIVVLVGLKEINELVDDQPLGE
jgi:hypothetical protein